LPLAKVWPAASSTVSPQAAAFTAACNVVNAHPLAQTDQVAPADGVETNALLMHAAGRAAGPSVVAPNFALRGAVQYRLSAALATSASVISNL
jgi:hypothetical protein